MSSQSLSQSFRRAPLSIDYVSIERLKPDPKNVRRHTAKQIRQIAQSIEAFGFNVPILVDAEGNVIAGHGRLLACKRLGWSEVPTIRLEHLSEAQKRAFMIADNRLTEIASWDDRLLAEQLQALSSVELDFDIETIGFDMGEIDFRIESLNPKDTSAAELPIPDISGPAVTRVGDLWLIGRHKLLCGDARSGAAHAELIGTERAAAVFSDPPYNVPIDGHVSGLGKVRHREFSMATGEMTPEAFTEFLTAALERMKESSHPGSVAYVCMDWRHVGELLDAARLASLETLNLCVWTKPNAGMGSLYRSQHELVFVFKLGAGGHRNNVQLGAYGRNRTNVWAYAVGPAFGRAGEEGRSRRLASDGQADGDDRGRDSRRDASRRHRARSISRQRRHPDGLRADRAAMLRPRTRSRFMRRHHSSMAILHRRLGSAGDDRRSLRHRVG